MFVTLVRPLSFVAGAEGVFFLAVALFFDGGLPPLLGSGGLLCGGRLGHLGLVAGEKAPLVLHALVEGVAVVGEVHHGLVGWVFRGLCSVLGRLAAVSGGLSARLWAGLSLGFWGEPSGDFSSGLLLFFWGEAFVFCLELRGSSSSSLAAAAALLFFTSSSSFCSPSLSLSLPIFLS